MEKNGNGNGNGNGQVKVDMFKSFSDPPIWMTQSYLENVLRESLKDDHVTIHDYKITSATKPGDNFASVALRVKVTYETKDVKEKTSSYIVKVEPYEEGFKKDVLSDTVLFETETNMYCKTLPEMQRLIEGVDRDEVIAPPLGYYSMKPYKIIFVEDISPEFGMSPKALDLETSIQVFEKLGKFHAVSVFMMEDNKGNDLEKYTEGFISKQLEGASVMLIDTWKSTAEIISGWGPEMKEISDKFFAKIPGMYPQLMKMFGVNKFGYNVLNHGDFHLKNILFRQGCDLRSHPDPIRFIDFQLCIWASPAIDLSFALYGMVNHEAREHRDHLIRRYHEQFKKTLEKLGYSKPIPTLLDVHVEMLRNGLMELFVATTMMTFLHTDVTMLSEEERKDMTLDTMAKLRHLTLESLKPVMMKLLVSFNNKGIFD